MADDQNQNPQRAEVRPLGDTEDNWCRAVSTGTGITVLALQVGKPPNISHLQKVLHKLQNTHPILRSNLSYNPSTDSFSFVTPTTQHLQLNSITLAPTSPLLRINSLCPLRVILEEELNNATWRNARSFSSAGVPVFFATVYELPDTKWVLTLRLHTAACDRTTAVGLLRELREMMGAGGETQKGIDEKRKGLNLGIEALIPSGGAKKSVWAHGLDVLSYSVSSLRLTNLKFRDVRGARRSEVVRLQMSPHDTDQIMQGCKLRGIQLCGVLAAAGILAAHSTKHLSDNRKKKYGVVTLTDCRPDLDPPLSSHHFGFYNSAILNVHDVRRGERLWDLARRSYEAFANSKKSNKHFTDMADLNFLMHRAIQNPSLTSSSSLRTSLITVFEEPVIDNSGETKLEVGLEDYMGCASVHGVGPSMAIFDTVRDGRLDCACVYPSPLHTREQMQELVDNMKRILIGVSLGPSFFPPYWWDQIYK
ncbi:hypothetical protein NMG60_11008494 [Bertholletia excelsa]